MVSFDLILVIICLIFILVSLYFELLGASFTFLIAVIILGIFGVLTPSEILSGFANEQIAVVIMLLLLGDVIRRTAVIEDLFNRVFKRARSPRGFLGRIMLIIAGFSAFLNNTPLVALMMPYVNNWCKRNRISPSKFLLPLSYAAILGGCATLIGTSTNLIVNGLVVDQKIIPGLPSLGIFDFVYVGIPMIIIGYLYMVLVSNRLLPAKEDLLEEFNVNERSYFVETQVKRNSSLIGMTIEESGLRNLQGLYLLEIQRNDREIFVVKNNLIIESGDILVFAGDTSRVADLTGSNSGLIIPSVGMMRRKKKTEVVEIVISHNSSLINKSLKDINFRAMYDAAVIGIHRNEEMIKTKLRDVVLKAGDVLLLYSGDDFVSRSQGTLDFYFISKVKAFRKFEPYKIAILFGGLFLAIILAALNIISLFMGLLILLMASLVLKVTNPKDLPKGIDFDLGLIIVMSLALGVAMIKSGAATVIANLLIAVFMPLGKLGILFGIYLITAFMAAYITNKAAVAILFPISLTTSLNLGLDPMPFILVVAYAAAANFMTPIGYQTNLMVYGPGGYSFRDFFRIGFPLTMIYMVVTVLILNLVYL
ncbi:MAG: SLC13 family permease [Bacteroidales bacterium]|nr:MAG: SLC13 family permease [Bacteroidales bacterium]